MGQIDREAAPRTAPRRRAGALALLILGAAVLGQAPGAAGAAPANRSSVRSSTVPPTPVLVTTLSQGVNTSSRLTASGRAGVVANVAWLEGRLDVILPHIHWTGGALPIDGIYDGQTATATKFFKTWANQARKALHLSPLFPKIDDSVGQKTESIISLIGGYFQVHSPGQVATSPQSDDQTTLMVLLNQYRAGLNLPLFTEDLQINDVAQAWTNHMVSKGDVELQDTDALHTAITACNADAAVIVARGGSIEDIAGRFSALHDPDTNNIIVNLAQFTSVGVGVDAVPGGYYVTVDFAEPCNS